MYFHCLKATFGVWDFKIWDFPNLFPISPKKLSNSFAVTNYPPTFALPNYKGSLIYVSTHSNQIAIVRPQSGG
jgi:hypothetical protein